ncbi:MAG TPA: transcription-repair coupling factor [Bacteroidia bacterium]|nr:transcription-repair coupling factor [Bacteroidia bacterium]
MDIESLKERYRKNIQVVELSNYLQQSHSCNIQLKGMAGSAIAFIGQAVIQNLKGTHLFVLPDKEQSAYVFNDLENLCGKDKVYFFPMSYKKPYEPETVDNANVLFRSEVLNHLANSHETNIIVTYPHALFEKVVTKKHLSENTFNLKRKEKVDLDFMFSFLEEYGFERVDFVVQPGEFSVRGGIIDVFSFSNDYPYRIEFFDDEIESIRTFDTATQLSVSHFDFISIIPNISEKLLVESRASFLDFISSDSTIWLSHLDHSADLLQKSYEAAEKAHLKAEQGIIKQLPPHELFIDKEVFLTTLSRFKKVEFGHQSTFNFDKVFQFNFSPQPSFNKNFELLIANLKSNVEQKYINLLFADTAKQTERLLSILEDVKASHGKQFSSDEVTPMLLSLSEGFIDADLKIACYTDHQIFNRYHRYKLKDQFRSKSEALTLKELKSLNPGDFVTHIDHGVGRFAGLEKIDVNGKQQEAIRLVYRDNDILYVSIQSLHRIAKYSGQEGTLPKLNKLGSNTWNTLKQKTKSKVKAIAYDLIKLYAKRKSQKGFEFSPDNYLQTELEASFLYEDTPDQVKSTAAVKKDMEAPYPMDRLICGDVGFGKTEIAIRAAFKAVCDSKQVVILVPTTILALQHFKTFKERLKDFPCSVDYINRFRSAKEQKETLKNVEEGKVDILIGTHRIVGKDVKFKDLGLMIIDEEQKFGVAVKDKLKTIKSNIDTLTLTATPIPRTLQFSMMGARDLSVIVTPPPNRYPVQTELHTFNEEIIRDAIAFEISRGGQVFFVHNRVQNIQEVAGMIQRLCPDARVIIAHGQMEGDKLEQAMMDFVDGIFDVLVATTIIEAGLDISNANTIVINNANLFGLSDLHQMRGRVGRSNKKAFCYLLAPPASMLTTEARKRLKAIEEFADLGSGFNIALRDLDIRGAGNLLGGEQSGFIAEIGFEMYMKILNEAIEELKESEFKNLFDDSSSAHQMMRKAGVSGRNFIKDCQIDTDMEILFSDDYIHNITERMSLYKELDDMETEEQIQIYEKNLIDRFGPLPPQAKELLNAIRLRWIAIEIGFEKVILKNNKMVGFFIAKQDSPFYESDAFHRVIDFMKQHPNMAKLKETPGNKLTMVFEKVNDLKEALHVCNMILK